MIPHRPSRRTASAVLLAAAALAAVTVTGAPPQVAGQPAVDPGLDLALRATAAGRLAPVQGFPGSDTTEALTAAEQRAQARGLVPADGYATAYRQMTRLPATGGAWDEKTRYPYDSDDTRYRDYYGNSTGGSGIVTGRVVALAAAGRRLYAGAANGGVFESASGSGEDWQPISDTLPTLSVGDLAVSPAGELWLATGEANTGATSYAGDGVWRRSGGSWSRVGAATDGTSPLSGTTINKLHFDPTGGWAYAATSRGLYRTPMAGTGKWQPVLQTNPAALGEPQASRAAYANIVNDVITRPGSRAVLVAAGWRSSTDAAYYGNGFWYSADGSPGSFRLVEPQGAINSKEIGNTTFAYSADGRRLYAVVQSTVLMTANGNKAANTVLAGVFRSNSGSLEGPWSKVAESTKLAQRGSALKQSIGGKGYGPGVQAWYNQALAVDPKNPDHVYLGLEEVYETWDGGTSWSAVGPYWNFYFPCWDVDVTRNTCPSTTHADQHDALFAGDKVLIANDGGVYSRPAASRAVNANGNATDWSSHNATLRALQYYAAAAGTDKALGGVVLSGGLQDNGGSVLRGLRPDGSTTDPGDGSTFPDQRIPGVMGSNFGGDGGDVIVDPRDGCRIVQEYVYLSMRKTTNCAQSQGEAVTTSIAPPDPAPRFIAPVEADPTDPDRWFAAGNVVWVNEKGFAIRDGGDWANAGSLGSDAAGLPNSTTALGVASGVAYAGYCGQCNNAGFTSGLARVAKVGGKWTASAVAAKGLPNRYRSGIWVDARDTQHVVVALNGFNRRFTNGPEGLGHLFESFDGGATFTSVDGNLPDVPADDVILADGGRTAYVATDLGVVKGTRSGTTGTFAFSRLGSNLPATTVMDLSVGPDGVLYAATHSRGIWGLPVASSTATRGARKG